MIKLFLLIISTGLSSLAIAASEPAAYFEGSYVVVLKNVSIKTLPPGTSPRGPGKLNKTTKVEIEPGEGGYAVFVDSYQYPLAILTNRNFSHDDYVFIETYSGISSRVISTTTQRYATAGGGESKVDRRLTLSKKAKYTILTYDLSQ